MASHHLNRLYQQHRGNSLGAALADYRLEAARQLLLENPEMSLKTTAYRCGYSSPVYFTACYRRHYGETPRRKGHD